MLLLEEGEASHMTSLCMEATRDHSCNPVKNDSKGLMEDIFSYLTLFIVFT